MSGNCEKCYKPLKPKVKVIRCLVFFLTIIPKPIVYYHKTRQDKAANSHIGDGWTREHLSFWLEKWLKWFIGYQNCWQLILCGSTNWLNEKQCLVLGIIYKKQCQKMYVCDMLSGCHSGIDSVKRSDWSFSPCNKTALFLFFKKWNRVEVERENQIQK